MKCSKCHIKDTPRYHPDNPDTHGLCWKCWDIIQLAQVKSKWTAEQRARWRAIENISQSEINTNCQFGVNDRIDIGAELEHVYGVR